MGEKNLNHDERQSVITDVQVLEGVNALFFLVGPALTFDIDKKKIKQDLVKTGLKYRFI